MTEKTQIQEFLNKTAARLERMGTTERRTLLAEFGITETAADRLGLGVYSEAEDLDELRRLYLSLAEDRDPKQDIPDGALIVPIVPADPEAVPTFTAAAGAGGRSKEVQPRIYSGAPLWLAHYPPAPAVYLTEDLTDLLALADLDEPGISAVFVPEVYDTNAGTLAPDVRDLLGPEDEGKKYILTVDNHDEESDNKQRLGAVRLKLDTVVLSKIGRELYKSQLGPEQAETPEAANYRDIQAIRDYDRRAGGAILLDEIKRDLENLDGECIRQNAERQKTFTQFNRASTIQGVRRGVYLDQIKKLSEREPLKTGLQCLDRQIGGIFPNSLYVLGGTPSVGKTSFCVQLADEITAQGQDVLYISLEQTKTELVSKSISRLSFLKFGPLAENVDGKHALTLTEILYQYGRENWTQDKDRALSEALALYGAPSEKYGGLPGLLYIVHSGEELLGMMKDAGLIKKGNETSRDMAELQHDRIGISDVRDLVRAYLKVKGSTKRPVIFVDYLQIMRPENEKDTDKQNMDRTISGLRRIVAEFGISIVVISSFNRETYKGKKEEAQPNLASFKESGGIEYGADVVLVLYDDLDGRAFTFDNKLVEREVNFKILKNRNGHTGGLDKLIYYPEYNCFMDVDRAKR